MGDRARVTLPATFTVVPEVNGEYDVCLFPVEAVTGAKARVLLEDELLAEGSGEVTLVTARLSAGRSYTIELYGEGTADAELAKSSLSRCFSQPIELSDGAEYAKLLAKPGDAHWYAITAAKDGAAILTAEPEGDMRLSGMLFDRKGTLLAVSDELPSGAFALSTPFKAGERYILRVSAESGGTGKYRFGMLRSGILTEPQSVSCAESLTLNGLETARLNASAQPEWACPLLYYDLRGDAVLLSKDGNVRGQKPGTAVITAYAYGGARAAVSVAVESVEATGVRFEGAVLAVNRGETSALVWKMIPENTTQTDVVLLSSDPEVAEVAQDGTLTAVGEGSATVTILADTGSDVLRVTVLPPVARYRALLIGEENYPEEVDTARPGTIDTLNSIAGLLAYQTYDGAQYRVDTAADVSRDELVHSIRTYFADARTWDTSLVYLSCHGFYKGGMSFFLMTDGSVLSATDLARELGAIPGRVILFADCCGSGGLTGTGFTDGITNAFGGLTGSSPFMSSKFLVFASALPGQDSYRLSFGDGSSTTVFARALCDAGGWSMERQAPVAMAADLDYDLSVNAVELSGYLRRRVNRLLSRAGSYDQTVTVWPEGDLTEIFRRVGE